MISDLSRTYGDCYHIAASQFHGTPSQLKSELAGLRDVIQETNNGANFMMSPACVLMNEPKQFSGCSRTDLADAASLCLCWTNIPGIRSLARVAS